MLEQLIAELKKSNRTEARCLKIILESGMPEAIAKSTDTARKCNEKYSDYVLAEMTFFVATLLSRFEIEDKTSIKEAAEKGYILHKALETIIQELLIARLKK